MQRITIDDLRLEPLIIDDAIQIDIQKDIDLMSQILDWRYCTSTVKHEGNFITEEVYDIGHFAAKIYKNDGSDEPRLKTLKPLLDVIENLVGEIKLERAKFNFTWHSPDVNNRTQGKHIDFNDDLTAITALYYVNDSDGDTKIWYETKTVSVSPKKGRLLIFPANLKHAGTNPSFSQYRIVLNIVATIDT